MDNDERFTANSTEDPDLMFTEREWILFYTQVWRDLKDGGSEPLFIAEWSGLLFGTRFRLHADHVNKHPEDYIYILCDFGKDAPERTWPISESDHLKYYDLKFVFQWKYLACVGRYFF